MLDQVNQGKNKLSTHTCFTLKSPYGVQIVKTCDTEDMTRIPLQHRYIYQAFYFSFRFDERTAVPSEYIRPRLNAEAEVELK